MFFYKYGRREHIEQFFADGLVQLGTLYSYDVATHGPAIGDDEEGTSYDVVDDTNFRAHISVGKQIPPVFGRPGFSGNHVITRNVSHNYAIYCVSKCLHQNLCRDFDPSYDAAILIERPFPFFHEVTSALSSSGIVDEVAFRHVAEMHYRPRTLLPHENVVEAFTKSPHYESQSEVRALWNIGEPTEKFYRFNAPKAAECCRMVRFDQMPKYLPGGDPEENRQEFMTCLADIFGS